MHWTSWYWMDGSYQVSWIQSSWVSDAFNVDGFKVCGSRVLIEIVVEQTEQSHLISAHAWLVENSLWLTIKAYQRILCLDERPWFGVHSRYNINYIGALGLTAYGLAEAWRPISFLKCYGKIKYGLIFFWKNLWMSDIFISLTNLRAQ